VLQLLFAAFSAASVDPSDLLKARMIIASYNYHARLLSPEPWSWHYQVYSGRRSRRFHEISSTWHGRPTRVLTWPRWLCHAKLYHSQEDFLEATLARFLGHLWSWTTFRQVLAPN